MSNFSDAFYVGLLDGAAVEEPITKSASAFMAGILDGVSEPEPTIMDKIASAVEALEVEDIEASAEDDESYQDDEAETTAYDILHRLLSEED